MKKEIQIKIQKQVIESLGEINLKINNSSRIDEKKLQIAVSNIIVFPNRGISYQEPEPQEGLK